MKHLITSLALLCATAAQAAPLPYHCVPAIDPQLLSAMQMLGLPAVAAPVPGTPGASEADYAIRRAGVCVAWRCPTGPVDVVAVPWALINADTLADAGKRLRDYLGSAHTSTLNAIAAPLVDKYGADPRVLELGAKCRGEFK